jgi:hypothetical protein
LSRKSANLFFVISTVSRRRAESGGILSKIWGNGAMAWTRSAPQRGYFAPVALGSEAGLQFRLAVAKSLRRFGYGDATRGALCMCTAVFVAAGITLPSLDQNMVIATLFVAAAIAALAALTRDAAVSDISITPVVHTETSIPRSRALPKDRALASLDGSRWQQLTHQMSHELRTPLNAVLGFSELMSHEVYGPMGSQNYSDYAHSINASGHQLLKSAEDALAITALLTAPDTRNTPHTTCCGTAVDQALAFLSRFMASKNTTFCVAGMQPTAVHADPQTLRQMLINAAVAISEDANAGARLSFASLQTANWLNLTITQSGSLPAELSAETTNDRHASSLVAETLADLAGASIAFTTSSNGTRSAVIRLPAANQADLFANV